MIYCASQLSCRDCAAPVKELAAVFGLFGNFQLVLEVFNGIRHLLADHSIPYGMHPVGPCRETMAGYSRS